MDTSKPGASKWMARLKALHRLILGAVDGTHTTDASLLAAAGTDLDRAKARTTEAIALIAALAAGVGMGVKIWIGIDGLVIATLAALPGGLLFFFLVLMLERRILQGMPPRMTNRQRAMILAGRGAMGCLLAMFQAAPFFLMAVDGPAMQEAQRMALKTASEFRAAAIERHQLNQLTSREDALQTDVKTARESLQSKPPTVLQAEEDTRRCVSTFDEETRPAIQRRIQGLGLRIAAIDRQLASKASNLPTMDAASARRDEALRQIERARQELKDAQGRCEVLAQKAINAARTAATDAEARLTQAEEQLTVHRKAIAGALDAAARDGDAITKSVQSSSTLAGTRLAAVWSLLKHDTATQLTLFALFILAFTIDTAAMVSKVAGGGKDSHYELARWESLRRREAEAEKSILGAELADQISKLEQIAEVAGHKRFHDEDAGATAYRRAGLIHDLSLLAAEENRDVDLAERRFEAIGRLFTAHQDLARDVKGNAAFEALLAAAIPVPPTARDQVA